MPFTITPGVDVQRDKASVVRHLGHPQEPFYPAAGSAPSAQALAGEYLREVAPVYGIDTKQLEGLTQPTAVSLTTEGTLLKFAAEKTFMGTIVVSYAQTHFGLPIWESGVSVTVLDRPLRVTSSHSTIHTDVDVQSPDPNAKYLPASINPATLAKLLALKDEAAHPKINASRLLLYQYDPTLRLDPEATRENKEELGSPGGPPTLPLPAVPRALKSGTHYVVTEVLFTLTVTDSGEINWRVFVETSTGAVL